MSWDLTCCLSFSRASESTSLFGGGPGSLGVGETAESLSPRPPLGESPSLELYSLSGLIGSSSPPDCRKKIAIYFLGLTFPSRITQHDLIG